MKAILLVPAAGDPHGLLAPGKCGAMPPIVEYTHVGGGKHAWIEQVSLHPPKQALVLSWDGEPVAEGFDRAARKLSGRPGTAFFRRSDYAYFAWSLVTMDHDDRLFNEYFVGHPIGDFQRMCESADRGWTRVDALADKDRDAGSLASAWALATVCAARIGGEVVVLR